MTAGEARTKLGCLIAKLRKQRNITVEELAQRVSLTTKHILTARCIVSVQCGDGPFFKDFINCILNVLDAQTSEFSAKIEEYLARAVVRRKGPRFRGFA
jgi:transcriptional regulator with XRE-family HTH domain